MMRFLWLCFLGKWLTLNTQQKLNRAAAVRASLLRHLARKEDIVSVYSLCSVAEQDQVL